MSQSFVQRNKNLSGNSLNLTANITNPLNITANIVTINKITCNINSLFQVNGSITTAQAVTASLQIPDIVHTAFYDGQYEIEPKAHTTITLNTNGKTLLNNVVIKKIPYFETSNLSSGYTVYIASEVD